MKARVKFASFVKAVIAAFAALTMLSAPMVRAADTPSGFPVPRFVSLKYGQVNGRTGPSRDHPVAWRYQRRGLPVQVVAETEIWRKIKDPAGETAWVHRRTLSGERTVMTVQDTFIRTRARESAPAAAYIEKDVILTLHGCVAHAWCEVEAASGHKGWAPASAFWGAGDAS